MLHHFIKQVAEICVANQIAYFCIRGTSFHISDQRKEAKERRMVRTNIYAIALNS